MKYKLSESSENCAGKALIMNISCTGSNSDEPRRKIVKRHLTGRLKRLLNIKRTRISSKKSAAHIPHLSSSFVREVRRGENDNTEYCRSAKRSNSSTVCVVDLPSAVSNHVDCSTDLPMGKCDCSVDANMPLLIGKPVCGPSYTHDNYVAMDCEFVGVGPRKTSALGRCSIVNFSGDILCDIYARPAEPITDYRTPWSGIRKADLAQALTIAQARHHIENILKGKIVIGHALHNDFHVLGMRHPCHLVCDTAKCKQLRRLAQLHCNNATSLKTLTFLLLGYPIQEGEHCSVEDARASMQLFRLVRAEWEAEHTAQHASDSAEMDDESSNSFLNDTYWPEDICN